MSTSTPKSGNKAKRKERKSKRQPKHTNKHFIHTTQTHTKHSRGGRRFGDNDAEFTKRAIESDQYLRYEAAEYDDDDDGEALADVTLNLMQQGFQGDSDSSMGGSAATAAYYHRQAWERDFDSKASSELLSNNRAVFAIDTAKLGKELRGISAQEKLGIDPALMVSTTRFKRTEPFAAVSLDNPGSKRWPQYFASQPTTGPSAAEPPTIGVGLSLSGIPTKQASELPITRMPPVSVKSGVPQQTQQRSITKQTTATNTPNNDQDEMDFINELLGSDEPTNKRSAATPQQHQHVKTTTATTTPVVQQQSRTPHQSTVTSPPTNPEDLEAWLDDLIQ